jgi:predicted neuraminidase
MKPCTLAAVFFSCLSLPVSSLAASTAEQPPGGPETSLLFPLETWHNHGSCIVELPNGDLLACWFHGSGERTADDVKVEAARLRKGRKQWERRFTLADVPGFPDTNPALFIDRKQQLWLLWPTVIANEWHTSLLQLRIASKYDGATVPRWDIAEPILLRPLNFAERVKAAVATGRSPTNPA